MRDWALKRRTRTRHLIELGGLVIKAGLVELTGDDRAALYGAFLAVAEKLRGEDREKALAIWKQKGKPAFQAEANANPPAR
ncbi:MAG: conjugal transfer protein TraD [Alphaproteobacteria bacterium]|nr:conjugal transfer protein TraD [Alphaproteobacteria bacterium]MBM3653190.1 conjugal transfer protein TraD [Alphaproteobacteria bacterium]